MDYDFDAVIDRCNTNSRKWDFAEEFFGVKDILPMWIADMDFRAPAPVIDALKKVAEHGIFGYSGIPQTYYEALINWMRKHHNWNIKKEWVVFFKTTIMEIRGNQNKKRPYGIQVPK